MSHVKDHGAVGDGIADDTAALMAAIATGEPLEWGDASDTYRVTGELTVTPGAPVLWKSDGASIVCDAATPIKQVVLVNAGGQSVTIRGTLHIDAARNAFSCLHAVNSGAPAEFIATHLHASNAYRSSQTHTNGDGIHIRGAWRRITLGRPVVENIAMAVGAVVHDNQGITGITVSAIDSARLPGDVYIAAPYIDGVLSEDVTGYREQDGIRVMTANFEQGQTSPWQTQVQIVGGTIRNAGGRSVKAQIEACTVRGLKVYRDVERAELHREFDFQKGGGSLEDVTVHYEGTGAKSIVCFGDGVTAGKTIQHGSVNGLKVIISGDAAPEQIITMRDTVAAGQKVIARGIEVVGGEVQHLLRVDATADTVVHAIVSDVIADISVSAILAYYGHPTEWTGDIVLSNVINTHATAVPMLTRSEGGTGNPVIHSTNVIGFIGTGAAESLDLSGTITGWAEVGPGCVAKREGGFIQYAFQLRSPSSGDVVHMMQLPEGWRPATAAVVSLLPYDSTSEIGNVFIGADGQVSAYRATSHSYWAYATVTLAAA